MNRSRAQLPRFDGDADVLASKITAIQPIAEFADFPEIHELHNSSRLILGDDNTRANMKGVWMKQWQPQVGGYFVIYGKGDARYVAAATFTARFNKVRER